ncbi:MAG: hypothetical protein L0213_07680 [Candidatus Dadabacteria bacterium]|nr:hypothetical protein [Candidatus Dadabacteria bacterium]
MRNKFLHYGGILVAVLGLILFFGPWGGMASWGYFISGDYAFQYALGIILIIVGALLFFFVEE